MSVAVSPPSGSSGLEDFRFWQPFAFVAAMVILSAGLGIPLESVRVGQDERLAAGDGEADDVAAAVVVLGESPDDNGVRALPGLHLGAVQSGHDLQNLHSHHGKRVGPWQ
jgi:hypothetical protein